MDIVLALLVIATLLVLVSLLQPIAARLRIPHTVMLAGLGIALGSLSLAATTMGTGPVSELASAIAGVELSAEAILFVFLPILLFEAGLNMDVRRMLDDIGPILTLAVVAVLVCSVVVGLALALVSDQSLIVCLLLGAIVATTDPVAVIGIFRDVGAPRRLAILVEGESLFNDAAAITLFTMLVSLLVANQEFDPSATAFEFVTLFVGGAAFGYVAARAALFVIKPLAGFPLAEITMTLALSYLAFIVGERYLHVSGVVAVVVAALVTGSVGRVQITPHTWTALSEVWEQVGFWASTLIFIFASMLVPEFLRQAGWQDAILLGVLVAAALLARAIVLWGLLPGLAWARIAEPVSTRYRVVILWGGLRGAVTLALALATTEIVLLDPEVKHFVGVLATGFVLFTLLINATTLGLVMRALGLDQLPPIERALRDRAVDLARDAVDEKIAEIADEHHIPADRTSDTIAAYRDRLPKLPDGGAVLDPGAQERVGLIALADREERLYLRHYAEGTVSRRAVVGLLAKAGRLHDGAKTGGRDAYLAGAGDSARFRIVFRGAILIQRYGRWQGPLAARLADRFEMLMISRVVIEALMRYTDAELRRLLGPAVCARLRAVLGERLEGCISALDALRLQYPDYERSLADRFLKQAALRMEEAEYASLLASQAISREIHTDLHRRLQPVREELAHRPPLDLGLGTAELVRRLPLVEGMSDERIAEICRMLKPIFASPDERIVIEGDRGDTMYFISSGAVEVTRGAQAIRLGRGDFFGELALLTSRRRTATVTAIAYCRLLELNGRDFRTFAQSHPDLRAKIAAVAAERQSPGRPAAMGEAV